MIWQDEKFKRSYSNAIGRWAAFGPYYAMFPLEFAFEVVKQYSEPGQLVIDPFAGRASSIYAAAAQGRYGFGVEINPVGWLYAQAKLAPSELPLIESRLSEIVDKVGECQNQAQEMPEFFSWCFAPNVLNFLLAARSNLDWKKDKVDSTLMAFLLVYLHGKLGEGLSNQMRQTKAMGPEYSVRWWKQRKMFPPEIDYYSFMLQRIRWRYAMGKPPKTESSLVLGDSTKLFKPYAENIIKTNDKKCSLLFTSPPYYGVTNYHKDQWLRLWLLGGEDSPRWESEKHTGRFESKETYYQLLKEVFGEIAKIMSENAVVYVRTDSREFTFATTKNVLRECFPGWEEKIITKPSPLKTQTKLFGNKSDAVGEIDIVLSR
jgi:DNA modification methylase